MNLREFERYLRVNLLGPGPRLMNKNLPDRGLTKVEIHWTRNRTIRLLLYTHVQLHSPQLINIHSEEKRKCL